MNAFAAKHIRTAISILSAALLATPGLRAGNGTYVKERGQQQWTLGTAKTEKTIELREGKLRVVSYRDKITGRDLGETEAASDELLFQAGLVRDIFGLLPFRALSVNPTWRTPELVAVAQEIYVENAFDRMQELAAALGDAGCDNADMLAHCRGPSSHVRGCWVVDAVLGKE